MPKTLSGSTALLRVQLSLDALGLPADHISTAMNSVGDVFACWQQGSDNAKQVYGLYISILPDGTYKQPREEDVIALGVRGKGVFPTESCHKPDCSFLWDDSFVATWPRISVGTSKAQLEMVRIWKSPTGGIQVERPAQGMGHVIRAEFNSGDGGVMPDVCGLGLRGDGRIAGVAYGEETLSNLAGATNYREYSVLLQQVTWPAQGAPTVGSVVTVATAVPQDDTDSAPLVGGLLLPDVCLDQDEDIVIAWDEYLKVSHPGQAGGDVSRIKVARLQGLGKDVPFTLIGSVLNFQRSTSIARPQRRPMVAAVAGSWGQSANLVHLCYGDQALTGKDELHYWKIDYRPTTPTTTEVVWAGTTTEHRGLPSAVACPFMAGALATEEKTGGAGRILAMTHDDGTFKSYLRPMVGRPWRPMSAGRTTKAGKDLFAMVYEGDGAGNSALYRAFLEIFLLP